MRKPIDCAAIFVHAGAGYHSITNESVHLAACEEYVKHLQHRKVSHASLISLQGCSSRDGYPSCWRYRR